MSTVSQSAPPVRRGTCRLSIRINSDEYSLKRRPALSRGSRIWILRKLTGERIGAVHCVLSHSGEITCSCPDCRLRGCKCKHIRALAAAGLVNRRLPLGTPFPPEGASFEGGA